MIKTLTPSEIHYLLNNLDINDIITYCSVHKDEIEFFTGELSLDEKDVFLSKLSQHKGFDADTYESAKKEISRALYYIRRSNISESDRIELLRPFFLDMPQRYEVLLAENIPETDALTFDVLIKNIEVIYAKQPEIIFDDWEHVIYLERSYLDRYLEYVKEDEAFQCLLHHHKSRALDIIKKYIKNIETASSCKSDLSMYQQEMRDKLNIILISIYLEQDSKPFYYLDLAQLNMYQGFEFEMAIEETLSAVASLNEQVKAVMMKEKNRSWIVKIFARYFG